MEETRDEHDEVKASMNVVVLNLQIGEMGIILYVIVVCLDRSAALVVRIDVGGRVLGIGPEEIDAPPEGILVVVLLRVSILILVDHVQVVLPLGVVLALVLVDDHSGIPLDLLLVIDDTGAILLLVAIDEFSAGEREHLLDALEILVV